MISSDSRRCSSPVVGLPSTVVSTQIPCKRSRSEAGTASDLGIGSVAAGRLTAGAAGTGVDGTDGSARTVSPSGTNGSGPTGNGKLTPVGGTRPGAIGGPPGRGPGSEAGAAGTDLAP